jgi:hypothetical protein
VRRGLSRSGALDSPIDERAVPSPPFEVQASYGFVLRKRSFRRVALRYERVRARVLFPRKDGKCATQTRSKLF